MVVCHAEHIQSHFVVSMHRNSFNPDRYYLGFSSELNTELQAQKEKRGRGISRGMSFLPLSKSLTFLCCSLYNNHLDILSFSINHLNFKLVWCCFFFRNDGEEEERPERLEKGTKVKRTLSSLRNRVTGSFNKDKVITHTHTCDTHMLTSLTLGLEIMSISAELCSYFCVSTTSSFSWMWKDTKLAHADSCTAEV